MGNKLGNRLDDRRAVINAIMDILGMDALQLVNTGRASEIVDKVCSACPSFHAFAGSGKRKRDRFKHLVSVALSQQLSKMI